ncbi:MAG: hypothetical protein JWP27_1702 [Flaviaesturariibacter sp.]|nr:hypothetical protein [Flaviaesturariibacter sp.]
MPNETFQTEQEAAVAILFSCVMNETKSISEARIEQLSRMLVLCSKFRGHDLNALSAKALKLFTSDGSKAVIEQGAPLIDENFRETLFAMVCEIMTDNGAINESESELLGMVALYLGMSVDLMRSMLTTYLIRNRWNVQVVDQ